VTAALLARAVAHPLIDLHEQTPADVLV